MKKPSAISDLLRVMSRLRSPNGCPWDRQQDHRSLRWHAVEEVYELLDAIEAGDDHELEEELGDLLLQVVFHCQLAKERRAFDFERVARHIADKLVRRHPHVFGDAVVETAQAQTDAWERQKSAERAAKGEHSAMDGVPLALPALLRARKLVSRAARAGLADVSAPAAGPLTAQRIGEMLFSAAELAERAGIDPEQALRDANAAYEARMRELEARR